MQRSDFRLLDRLRVRWAEIDAQQIVFNAHYLMYFDTAVASYWRSLALPYAQTMEALAKLKPVFDRKYGSVTAGNSSPLTDGASAVLVMAEENAKALGYEPLAYIRSYAVAAVDPGWQLLMGPVFAVPLALDRAEITWKELGLVEVHEAFAAQVLSNAQAWASPEWAGDACDHHLGAIAGRRGRARRTHRPRFATGAIASGDRRSHRQHRRRRRRGRPDRAAVRTRPRRPDHDRPRSRSCRRHRRRRRDRGQCGRVDLRRGRAFDRPPTRIVGESQRSATRRLRAR